MSTLTYNWTFYVDFCIKPFLPFLSFCPFSFGYCIDWFFTICGLWLLLPLVSSNFSYNCLVDISILNELPNFLTLFSRYLHTEWVTKLLLQLSSRHLYTEWVTKLFLQLSSRHLHTEWGTKLFLQLSSRHLHTEWGTKLFLQVSSRHLHTEWVTKFFLHLSSDISILN